MEEAHAFDTGGDEVIVLPLAGSCRVTVDGETFELQGREGAFMRPHRLRLRADRSCTRRSRARAASRSPPPPPRGAFPRATGRPRTSGSSCAGGQRNWPGEQRPPPSFERDKLIASRRSTPNGNRNSHPLHRHDELEEDPPLRDHGRGLRVPARVRRHGAAGRGAQRRPHRPAQRLPRPAAMWPAWARRCVP